MSRIAVCDDERDALNTIQGYLDVLKAHYPDIFYEPFFSGEDLLEHYQRAETEEFFDIIFMDVEMGNCKINGLSTITEIRKIDENPLVIYVTKPREYMRCHLPVRPLQNSAPNFRKNTVKTSQTLEK